MDIKIPHSLLINYLDTNASVSEIARCLTLCGPSVDRLTKQESEYVYETEIITNRIDSLSAFGLAREAAAILPQFGYTAKLQNDPYVPSKIKLPNISSDHKLSIQILDQSLAQRLAFIVLKALKVKPSPISLKKPLELAGIRSVNNLVDITNYLTLSLGQPVHIFDYDKISGHSLTFRLSRKGEPLTTLDHKNHILRGNDIVIEDGGGKLIDLCGIMGGLNSEVDENTRTAILFVQTYNPKLIRKTSLYAQERTLAAQIFEKQPDPYLVFPTILEGISLLKKYAYAEISSNLIDIFPVPPKTKSLTIKTSDIDKKIGIAIPDKQLISILSPLGFKPKINAGHLVVIVPSFRLHDINIPEDIIEEIARIYGYFRLPKNLPPSVTVPQNTPILSLEKQLKTTLFGLGYVEIYNNSLVSSNSNATNQIEVQNPLSNEYRYLRTNLYDNLLKNIQENHGKYLSQIKIFEIGAIYTKNALELPSETPHLSLIVTNSSFRDTKGQVETLFQYLHLSKLSFVPNAKEIDVLKAAKSLEIYYNKKSIGYVGEVKSEIAYELGQQSGVYLVDLNLEALSPLAIPEYDITPINPLPPIREEVTLGSTKPIGNLLTQIKSISPLITNVRYLSSYNDNHSFELEFTSPTKNLTQKDIEPFKKKILEIK